ncbi:hypothetical protein [uncultured Fibrella sp.]|uniref:hypothetical protein n=1 Tax=uncultured Fibrella sp. TaxID=1284596 RepID=UPI0035CAF21A
MKLTWTFYLKPGLSVSLTVIYVPELDEEHLRSGGFLDTETNCAYVDWPTYRRFDDADVKGRRDAFQQLTPLTERTHVKLETGKELSFGHYGYSQ